ncbi:hypothetical protein L7F22_021666 [Adiantum nelumboides]|nr:hypothetical protein [Adiantum nelumboides]
MISRSIGRKRSQRQSLLQGFKLYPLFFRLGGHRWISTSLEDLSLIRDIVKRASPVHARSPQSSVPQETSRRKPVSLPLADHPVEVQQLVSVVRRKGKSTDLQRCLDALEICINSHHVAKTLTLLDDAESAIQFFGWAVEQPGFRHNVYTCVSLVTTLSRAKEFDKIWEVLSEMYAAGSELTDACFNITIKAYGEMGNYREAINTLHKMRKFDVQPTAYSYNTLISALVKSQKLDLALEIYHEMLQAPLVQENMFSSSMMVSALCNAGRLQEAHEMAIDASKRGCLTSSIMWHSLINGLCKAGKVEEGIKLISVIKDMGIEPSVVTYGIIIGGLCKLGKLSDAMAYLGRMKSGGLEPNSIIYASVMDAMCKAGRIDEAHDLLKTISLDDGNQNFIFLNIFVKAYSHLERMDEACAMHEKMIKSGFWPCASTYAMLMQGLCKAGRLKEALKLFEEMKQAKVEPNAAIYTVMIQGLAKAGFEEEAEKMFQEMFVQGYEANSATCSELIKCLCQQGSLDTANRTLRTMLKKTSEKKWGTAFILLKELCDANKMDSAYQFFEDMLEHGIEPSTFAYNILIKGAFKADHLEKALELCSDMRSKGCDPDIYTYVELYKIAWKAKRADALLDIYHDMRKQHVQASPFVFTILLKALCRMNRVPEACSLCSEILDDWCVSLDNSGSSSSLEQTNFVELQLFLPLLIHLQDRGRVVEMVKLWDSILQKGFFRWNDHSDICVQKTL